MNKHGQIKFTMRPKLESSANARKEKRKNRRQLRIEVNDKLYADFFIALERDGVHDIANFIRALIILYVENNKNIRPAIREIKKMLAGTRIKGKDAVEERNEDAIDDGIISAEGEKKKFNLSKEEVNDIFDILEKDLPIF